MLSYGTRTELLPYIVTMLRSNYAKPASSCIMEGHVAVIAGSLEIQRTTPCSMHDHGNSTQTRSKRRNDTPTGGVGRRSKSRTTWRARRTRHGSTVAAQPTKRPRYSGCATTPLGLYNHCNGATKPQTQGPRHNAARRQTRVLPTIADTRRIHRSTHAPGTRPQCGSGSFHSAFRPRHAPR